MRSDREGGDGPVTPGSHEQPSPSPPGSRRLLVVVPAAVLLVVAVSLIAAAVAGDRRQGPVPSAGSLAQAVTGSTDVLTAAEASAGPPVPSAPGRQETSRERWLDLLQQLEAALEAQPDDVNLKRKLAISYYNLGMLEEAAAVYEELLAAADDPVLRNRLGNTVRDMGDTAAAESHYRAALAADPELVAAYVNLAELLWRQGRDSEALALLDQGLGHAPEDRRGPLEDAKSFLDDSGKD